MADSTRHTMSDIARLVVEQCGDAALFLHGRRRHPRETPDSGHQHRHGEGLISLLAVAATGVYVIGAHDRSDAALLRRRSTGPDRSLIEELDLGRTDVAALLDDLGHQLAAVRSALGGHLPAARVSGVVCLWLPSTALLGSPTVGGVPLLNPTGTAKMLRTPGPLDGAARRSLYDQLADHLPGA
jgi:hypothetical protein